MLSTADITNFILVKTSTIAAASGTTLTLDGNAEITGSGQTLKFGAVGYDGTVAVQKVYNANYTASAKIVAGTLLIDGADAGNGLLDFIAGTNIAAGATLDIGGFDTEVKNISGTGKVTNSGGVATLELADTSTFAGVIQDGAGVTNIEKLDFGSTTTLSGVDTYTGTTTVTVGTLQLGGSGVIHDSSSLIVNGGTFDLNGNSETVGSLSGTGGSTNLGTGTLTVTQTADLGYAGGISGTGGLIHAGTSTLTLSGTANTATGMSTNTSGSTLNLSSWGGSISNSGDLDIRGNLALDGTFTNASTGKVTNSGNLDLELTGITTFTSNGSLDAGAGTITITITITITADNFVYQDGHTEIYPVTINAGTLTEERTGSQTYAGDYGATNLATSAAGIFTTGGTVTTTGTFTHNSSATATINHDFTVATFTNNQTVDLNGSTITGDVVNNGTVTVDGIITGLVTNNTNMFTQTCALSVGGLSGAGNIDNGGSLLTLTRLPGTPSNNYSGEISGTGGLTVDIGDDTQVLSGTNTYTGDTTLTSGTVSISNDGALGAAAGGVRLGGGMLLSTADMIVTKDRFNTLVYSTSTVAAASGTTLTLVGDVNCWV